LTFCYSCPNIAES